MDGLRDPRSLCQEAKEGLVIVERYLAHCRTHPDWKGASFPVAIVMGDPENGLDCPRVGLCIFGFQSGKADGLGVAFNECALMLARQYSAFAVMCIGHELGHLHRRQTYGWDDHPDGPWELEHECDLYSERLARDLGYPNGSATVGLQVYIGFMKRAIQYESVWQGLFEHGGISHPPLRDRLEKLAAFDEV